MVEVVFTSDSATEFHVLLHHCDSVGMDSAKVGVFKKTSEVGFGGFLESKQGLGLETEIRVNTTAQ